MQRRHIAIFPIVIALAVFAFQYFGAETVTNPETGRKARVGLSAEQEQTLGLQSFQQVLTENEAITTGRDHEMVIRVVQRLAAAMGEAGKTYQWQAALLRSDQPNAFCLPGGKIAVYTGILRYTQNEAALAAVLGHEMGHAIARHGSQRVLDVRLAQTALSGVQYSLLNMDPRDRGAVMAALGAGAQYGVLLPFSRKHETEADEMGLMYMARAGYDPHEAIDFWQRMENASGSQPPEFLSTHPSHGTRIQNLQRLMPEAETVYAQVAKADYRERR